MFDLDYSIFGALYRFATSVPYLEWVYVFLASYLPYIVVVVFLYELLRVRELKKKFYIFFLAIVSALLSWGVVAYCFHFFWHRARPFIFAGAAAGTSMPSVVPLIHAVASSSFPSGHVSFLVPVALSAFLINRRAGIWISVLTLLIGFGRIAVGVHWPSDVLGGILIGAVSYAAAYKLLPRINADSA
ncbi:MAG: phosphatase PAP2 family protein [Patescibacteria group bacterium]|nr:phosphatase PAP2 family protein [Patescibacteria group bacterium]